MSEFLIENVPMVLDAGFASGSYKWSWNKRTLPWATNRVLVLDSPQEANGGTYTVVGDDQVRQYRLLFRRSVRVLVNGDAVLGDSHRISKPSTVTLIPYLSGLPVRYTLDGTEPTAVSPLYSKPFPVTNSVMLRAAIIIPEGDSIKIIK